MDRFAQPTPALSIGLAAVSLVGGLLLLLGRKDLWTTVFILLFAAATGAMAHAASARLLPEHHISRQVDDQKRILRLRGFVSEAPAYIKIHGYHQNAAPVSFVIDGLLLIGEDGSELPLAGRVRVSLDAKGDALPLTVNRIRYGTRIQVTGRIARIAGATNPGQMNFRKYNEGLGIYAEYSFLDPANVTLLEGKGGNRWIRWAAQLKRRLNEAIFHRSGQTGFLPPSQAAMVSALTLGDREGISTQTRENFKKSGTMHFLAISGLHLTILTSLLFVILRLCHLGQRPTALIVAVVVLSYAVMTELRPPVVRASVMITLYLLGEAIHRKRELLNVLAFAALVILVSDPASLFAVGFQLSFVAVASMILLHRRLDGFLSRPFTGGPLERLRQSRIRIFNLPLQYVRRSLNISLSVWIGLFPLLALYFHISTPMTVVANVVLFPIVAAILYLSVLIFVLGGVLGAYLSTPYVALGWAVGALEDATGFFVMNDRAHLHMVGFTLLLAVLYYAVGILWVNRERLRLSRSVLAAAGAAVIIAVIVRHNSPVTPDATEITLFDVGNGTTALIQTASGETILYDGKGRKRNAGKYVLLPYLDLKRVRKLDAVIASPAPGGRAYATPQLIDTTSFDQLFVSTTIADFSTLDLPLQEPSGTHLLGFRGTSLEIFSLAHKGNTAPAIVMLRESDRRVLILNDLSSETVRLLLESGRDLRADIALLPNRGASTRELQNVLKAVRPRTILASGRNNRFLDRLQIYCDEHAIRLYATAHYGAITLRLDGSGPASTVMCP